MSIFATLLSGGGAGAVIAGVVYGIVSGLFGKGKTRAQATQILTEAAGDWVQSVQDDLKGVKTEIREMRLAIEDYTDAVEGILPAIEHDYPNEATTVRRAGRKLRQVI